MSPFVSQPAAVTVVGALAVEQGAIYHITGPDGTRAVLNDSSDADFVGFLTEPPSGLERGGIRENAELLPEADGGVHGAFYRDRMPFTLQGILDASRDGPSAAEQNRILRATNAMRRDAMLRWVPSAIPEGVQVAFREQQPTRITGGRPKMFLIGGVAEDPRVYSQTLKGVSIDPNVAPAEATTTNIGSAESWPRIVIRGPITNPHVRNATLGYSLALVATLATGEYIVIDTNPRRRRIRRGPSTADADLVKAAGTLTFATSRWWPIVSGANTIAVTFATVAAGAQVVVEYRDAWG